MSGKRIFLDTNAIVQLLSGNQEVVRLLADAEYVATSVICELELLAFPRLSSSDKRLLADFLKQIDVVNLTTENENLKEIIIQLRSAKMLKLPDAIVAASSLESSSTLLTADKHLLDHPGFKSQTYEVKKM